MIQTVYYTGVPFAGNPELPRFLRQVAKLAPQCAGIRRWGAAALDLAYVAAGRYDGFWEPGLNAWDIAGGVLLVKEAGGFIEPLEADTDILDGNGIVAANPQVFGRLAKIVREA